MVVPAGGAWLALHVLLLLAAKPAFVFMAVTSPSSASSWQAGPVSDNVTTAAHVSSAERQQAVMSAAEPYYRGQEDIQVGCRELRAKRYISDGFCTSTKPIKEVVCAGNCLPIRNLPWYAEFVKMWAKPKVREWQCEEDIVRRKTVRLLCRNGDYRTYRIKVVKSCKCKRIRNKHNRTVSGEGKENKKSKKKRKKDRRRRGKKNRRGERRNRKEEQEEEVDVSQTDQRQEGSRQVKERRGRKRNRKRPEDKEGDRNLAPVQGGSVPAEDSVTSADSERHKALADPSR